MSDKKKNNGGKPAGKVISISVRCSSHGCKEKPKRLNFCTEHFAWFKEGLITRHGEKAKDFGKKYQDHMNRKSKQAA